MDEVKNVSGDVVDVLFDGLNVHFEPGEVKRFVSRDIAAHVASEDHEGKRLRLLAEVQAEEAKIKAEAKVEAPEVASVKEVAPVKAKKAKK